MGGLLVLPLIDGFWPLVVITVFLSSMLGNIAITMSYLTDSLPDDIQGTGLGFLRATNMLLGASSPTLFGLLAEYGFFDEGFVVLAAMAGIMILLVFRLPALSSDSVSFGDRRSTYTGICHRCVDTDVYGDCHHVLSMEVGLFLVTQYDLDRSLEDVAVDLTTQTQIIRDGRFDGGGGEHHVRSNIITCSTKPYSPISTNTLVRCSSAPE